MSGSIVWILAAFVMYLLLMIVNWHNLKLAGGFRSFAPLYHSCQQFRNTSLLF